MTKEFFKQQKGITLIVLVVTIIILIILAGISVNMLLGNDGIITKTLEAKAESERTKVIEEVKLDITGKSDKLGKISQQEILEILNKYFDKDDIDRIENFEDLTKELKTKDGRYKVTLKEILSGVKIKDQAKNESITIAKPEDGTSNPFLPTPDSKITNNSLETGLTIKDGKGNEWVWIVVPKKDTVYVKTGLGITEFTEDIYTKIEEDLKNYCKTDKNKNKFIITYTTDDWYAWNTTKNAIITSDTATEEEKLLTNGCGMTYEGYYTKKKIMLKSIYENGGFYIGKYETGSEQPRGSKNDKLETAVITQDKYPYNYVTCSQAEGLAESLATGGRTITMLYGIQWDLVLRYLNEMEVSIDDIKTNSGSWGNYDKQPFTINRGEYAVGEPWNKYIPYTTDTTGKVENNKKVNNESRKFNSINNRSSRCKQQIQYI